MEIKGVGIVDGIAKGKVWIIQDEIKVDMENHQVGTIEEELQHLDIAIEGLNQEYQQHFERLLRMEEHVIADIVEMHQSMLNDNTYLDHIKKEINNGNTALVATQKATDSQAQMLRNLDNEYLSERALDVEDIGTRLLYRLKGEKVKSLVQFPEDVIIVTRELFPSFLTEIDQEHLKGIIIENGSGISHTAILAQTLNIPTLINCNDIKCLKQGDSVILECHEQVARCTKG